MAPVVGYWDLRGLGQPIRNLLIYKGVDFEDKRYKFGPAPDFNREEWLKEKFTLGIMFPNLPYYIDGDVKLSQSLAIMRYLAQKHDLGARDAEETMKLDVMEQQARDLAWWLIMTCYSSSFEEQRLVYEKAMEDQLRIWDDHLQGNVWAFGDRLTYVDFLLYEALDWNYEFKADAFQPFPVLLAYMKRFEELPNLKEYFASDEYSKWPIMGPQVKWGHFKE
uniref:Glutathione S-transferase n=1 Tax=Amblyomma cajennense TaxID=34607 RepID=A0A023FI74_AMBCJ